jgi:nitrate/nitrite-specific signal transduction histidine kinase
VILPSIRPRFQRLGLQRRIMLYVTAGLVAFSAIYGFVALQAIQQATAQVFRERLLTALTVSAAMDENLAHLQDELQDASVAVAPALAANDLTTARISLLALYNHLARSYQLTDACRLSLTDPQGNVLWTEPAEPAGGSRNLAQLAYLSAAFQSQRALITNSTAGREYGRTMLVLATPIRNGTQLTDYLVGELDRTDIGTWLETSLDAPAPNGMADAVELIDDTGRLIASRPAEDSSYGAAHFQLIAPLWQAGQPGTQIHAINVNDQDHSHVIAFAPLTQIHWAVVIEQDEDEALALPRSLQFQFLGFGLFALLGGLVLAWLTTRTVVRPINALTHASQEIAAGNLEQPLDVSGSDEVGALARSFDEMRVELKQSRGEIASWNRELETRVEQRTRELAALVASAHALTSTLDLDRLFETVMQQTREVLPPAEGIALFLYEPATQLLAIRSSFGFDATECAQVRFGVGEAIAGRVFQAQTYALPATRDQVRTLQLNFSASNRIHFHRAARERGVQSALGVPFGAKGTRLGALMLYNFSQEGAFADSDVPVLQALADQVAAALENAELYAARTQLLAQVIKVQEEERQRVAREIHDELGQLLTRLSINLKMCEAQVPAELTTVNEQLAATQVLVWQTIEQAHRLIVELRPTLLDELGLESALREELAQRLAPLGIITALNSDGSLERLPAPVDITVFRIVQEAVSNVARHAHAQHASVSLRREGHLLEVVIEDDGVGLPANWRTGTGGHRPLGLLGMQERAELLGGTLTIDSSAPRGTRYILRVPLERTATPVWE